MFQGRTFKIRHLSKNRYEFVDAYSVTYGTASELLGALTEHQQRAQRTAVELALAKQQIKQRAAQEGVLDAPAPEKEQTQTKEQPAPAPAQAPKASPPSSPVKEHAVRVVAPRALGSAHLAPPAPKTHRRRPNSLGYLRALEDREQAEKRR